MDETNFNLTVRYYLQRKGINVPKVKDSTPASDWIKRFLREHPELTAWFAKTINKVTVGISAIRMGEHFEENSSSETCIGEEIKAAGPIFIEENLTAELHLNILENVIDLLIPLSLEKQINEGNLVLYEQNLLSQQDGASPLHAVPVRQWLHRRFPGKWIGRRGAVEWPARSPGLTPLDLFLWANLKSVVYIPLPEDIQELKN
ncbi:hypothetical protein ANN_10761 [Periplaneta americana]|uniref:Uncharacterized protein n=1 Tax=Periplaneta americana TaxID=6978 RepID=A0ABQ8T4N2_PERAM|nr:hypothetical protein ANN_10761 [Periplaneta americana]